MDFTKGNISAGTLGSEVLRQAIGERNVDIYSRMRTDQQGLSRGQRFSGFGRLIAGNLLDWSIRNIGNYILQSALTLYSMDWSKTDKEIEDQIKANETIIASQLGTLSANTLVYSLGIGMTTTAAMKYPVIAGQTALLVAEEGGDEVRASIRGFLTATRQATASSAILSTYLTGRKLMFGAQTEKREPWIASDQLDKIIESNKDPKVKAYWNAFKDQTEDAVFDLGYIVNMGMLEAYEVSKRSKEATLGKQRIVELIPDKSKPDESVWVYGNQSQVIPQVSSLIAQSRMLHNKDVGEIIGQPYSESQQAENSQRVLRIYWSEHPKGGQYVDKDGRTVRAKTSEMKLSDVKPNLSFQDLKQIAETYQRGRTIVTAKLDNRRQTQIYVASPSEGQSIIRKAVAKTTAKIVAFSNSEQDPENPIMRKDTIQMFPWKATLEVKRPTSVLSDIQWRDREGNGFKILRTKTLLFVEESASTWETLV